MDEYQMSYRLVAGFLLAAAADQNRSAQVSGADVLSAYSRNNKQVSSQNIEKMGDRYNIHSQLEHLQSKYIGTGHADTTKYEWLTNQHRDSLASYMGHYDMQNYFAIALNETKGRVRFDLMERMLQPCGPPPEKPEE